MVPIDVNQIGLVHWHSTFPILTKLIITALRMPLRCRFWWTTSKFEKMHHKNVLIFGMFLECHTCYHSFRWLGYAIKPLFVVLGIKISRSLSTRTWCWLVQIHYGADELVSVPITPNRDMVYVGQFNYRNGLMDRISLPSDPILMD